MNDFNTQNGVKDIRHCPQKPLFQGTLGFIKAVDISGQTVACGSGIILNDNTVVTQAQYVYDISTYSFFPQIQFETGNDSNLYHVTEAYLLNPTSISLGKNAEYAILKLDNWVQNSKSLIHLLSQDVRQVHERQLQDSLQQKYLQLQIQLVHARLRAQQAQSKLNETRQNLRQANNSFRRIAIEYLGNDPSFFAAADIFKQCLDVEQQLYGDYSLQTVDTRWRLADVYARVYCQNSQVVDYYHQIIDICEGNGDFDNQVYADTLYQLGSKYSESDNEAIKYLEQALTIYAKIGSYDQQACARTLMEALQRAQLWEGAENISERYRL